MHVSFINRAGFRGIRGQNHHKTTKVFVILANIIFNSKLFNILNLIPKNSIVVKKN